MRIKINGVEPPVQPSKFEPSLMDLDDEETTTRTADGTLTRDRIAVKRQFPAEWPAMRWDHLSTILKLMKDEFVEIYYPDPETGQYETKTFYAGNRKTGVAIEKNGVLWWSGLQVTLTEQ